MRTLVGSQDDSIVDLVLRVRHPIFLSSTPKTLHHAPTNCIFVFIFLFFSIGLVYDPRAIIQDNHDTHAPINQPYEELGCRTVCCGPIYRLPTCVRIHQAVGCAFEE